MSDANAYFADPARLQAASQQIGQVSDLAQKMLQNFLGSLGDTDGWEGENDTFAKSVRPNEVRERETTTETTGAVVKAIVAISTGTTDNATSILTTQASNTDAIQQQAGSSSSSSNSGRR
ncbi:hypothetical protein ACFWBB_22310 [Streptomyces sp. NPDC060000]|uniref:hypothetical protein n=1 Tax=Streptomyces sp. NPDC060000 TaxID=3347031 RepID=UPI0036C14753